jgi:sporulation protein YlmC with PRC-barrel domain
MAMVSGEKQRVILGAFLFVLVLTLANPFPAPAAEGKGKQEGVRADQLIDQVVRNDRGQEIGSVDDLIMSRRGRIKKVILEVGGFLEIGYRLVAIPFRSLQIDKKGDVLYKVTKEQLERHSSFHYESEGLLGSYFSPPPPYGSFALGQPAPYGRPFPYGHLYHPSPGGRYPGEYGAWGWEYYPERFRVSGILDRRAWNEEGVPVGKIDDLIIDPNGQVQTLILSVGWSLAMEEKLVALPFRPLKVSGSGIVIDVTRRELEGMPAFRGKK